MTADQLSFVDLDDMTPALKRAVLLDTIRAFERTHHGHPWSLWEVLEWAGKTDLFTEKQAGSAIGALARQQVLVYVDSVKSARPSSAGSRLCRWRLR